MKKHKITIFFVIIFSTIIIFSGMKNEGEVQNIPLYPYDVCLEEIPKDYSLKEAKEDGCVVFENSDITSGEDAWMNFVADTKIGEKASLRLAYYYTLDPDTCAPEYYEAEKDNYPVMYVKDLYFDGQTYTIKWYEEGEKFEKNYKYLVRCDDKPQTENATFKCCTMYILTDDNTVTWDKIFEQMISSYHDPEGGYIDYCIVYENYVWE